MTGFLATLTPEQAERLAAFKQMRRALIDEAVRVHGERSPDHGVNPRLRALTHPV
jgi:hypothetical protein